MGLLDYHPQVSIQPATGTNMCVSCYAQSWEDSRGVATPFYHLHIRDRQSGCSSRAVHIP